MAARRKRTRASRNHDGRGADSAGGAATAEIGARGKWTAAAAARTARDARIATARHLRTAQVAHQWEMTRLASSSSVWMKHLRAQAEDAVPDLDFDDPDDRRGVEAAAAELLFGGAGLRPPYPASLQEGARRLLDLRAADLDQADLYVLSPSMCDVVIAAAQTLAEDDLTLVDEDDLPSRAGMVLLPHPVLVRAVNGHLGDDRAYAWTSPAQLSTVTEIGQRVLRPAVRVHSYLDSHGPVRPDSFRDMATLAAAQGTPLPLLLPDGIRTTPYRITVTDDMRASQAAYGRQARADAARWKKINADLGFNEDDQVDDEFEYRPGDEIASGDDMFAIRFLYAFWRLCSQDIAQLDTVAAGHNAQVLAERAGVSADVRVVTVRPSSRAHSETGPGSRDWQHRWVVRMHKVRQWYPSEQRHKVIYRGPYIKGPAGKPLLGGVVVRNLTRPRRSDG